jgi:hypothetical protein
MNRIFCEMNMEARRIKTNHKERRASRAIKRQRRTSRVINHLRFAHLELRCSRTQSKARFARRGVNKAISTLCFFRKGISSLVNFMRGPAHVAVDASLLLGSIYIN